ncbi:phosphotransferase family protein [Halorubrum cibi]|uniref:Predicted kinase, aminoglycoside phosphotransferase (APT) family n=1 Tax=Halorubrum cibi TaxID=413815 RepID=A0A521C2X1_9EURY|nr:aminoglycoside phosphotransferase family protein [Halorubrum cibi]SMO53080.1 Predicted kinase, aminoglycoside phosphotransferase (APT) family [Halorubrum cibi]
MDASVETALAAAFPDRSVEELVDVGPSWNGGNETVGVDFTDGGRAYLKVALDGDGSRIARERAVLEYVSTRRPIPVPAVVAADPNAQVPYLATAPAPGRDLHEVLEEADDDRREALSYRVGETLAILHAERFENHGEIRGGGGDAGGSGDPPELDVATASWTDTLLSTIEYTREIGTTDRLARHFDAVIDCVESNRALLDVAPAALLHGDIAPPNAFLAEDDGGAASAAAAAGAAGAAGDPGVGLLDWELAHVGDPARDLVRARDQLCNGFDYEGPERFGEAVYRGYRDRAGDLPEGFTERRPVYRVVRVLGRSGFLDQWVTYLDEPMGDLVERIDAELDARLAAAGE